MFFNDWRGLAGVAIAAITCYPILILFLRLTGKRTLAKLNAFDLVVTVALGSTLATVIVSRQTPILEGLLALLLLVLLQYGVAWLSVRSHRFQAAVKSEPRLLYGAAGPDERALKSERLTIEELRAAARSSGTPNLDNVRFIVLETDGTLSVIREEPLGELSGVDQHRPTAANGRS